MNTISVDEFKVKDRETYEKFMASNSGSGNLKIRATFASEALPVNDLNITVTTVIDDYKVIFFEGNTDSSGMIMNLSLPAPKIDSDNLIVPSAIKYEITANYFGDINKVFDISMYDGICVVQNITLVPDKKRTDAYGS